MATPSLPAELKRRQSNAEKVAAFFREHVNEWVGALDLETVGGRQAWRTRVSDCRKKFGMHIENRQRRIGEHAVNCPALQAWDVEGACSCDKPPMHISEYRYLPHEPLGRDASAPSPDRWPVHEAYADTFRLT